jgi:putative ABC transport system permease protein
MPERRIKLRQTSKVKKMWRQNLVLFVRNINRNKTSFFINLTGLSSGLACVLLIYLWVQDELLVDKFHEKDSRLFQVMVNTKSNDKVLTFEWTPGPLAEALAAEMPEVQQSVAVMPSIEAAMGIVSVGETSIKAEEKYVGKDFFNVFSYELIQGEGNQVLSEKNSIVVSDELAQKLFPANNNIVGSSIEWNKGEFSGVYQISGIFKKPPANSTAQFDLLFTFELFRGLHNIYDNWKNGGPKTYVVLKKGSDIDQFNQKISAFLQKKSNINTQSLFVRKYSDQYLYGKYENGKQAGGRIRYVRLFIIIALLIMVIACINFMNLSTVQATNKIKEVGVNKALCAKRIELILQYLGRSILMTFIALFLAIMLVELLLPQFNVITGKYLTFNLNLNTILTISGITLFIGIVAGSYPALYISGFNPATIFKGKFNTASGELFAIKGLVIFQFIISAILIVSVFVVYKQIEFIRVKNLGFNKDNIISFKGEGKLEDDLETFLFGIKNIPGVEYASNYHGNLTVNVSGTNGVIWEGKMQDDQLVFKYIFVGYDFTETLGIEMKEGRSFSRKFNTENSKIIFNETAIKKMGLSDPVGKTINLWGENKQITGVVNDFHFESIYEPLKPCFLLFSPNEENIMVKIRANMLRKSLTQIEKFYKEFNPGLPFDYKFLDDDFQLFYESENLVAVLSRYFAGLAIIISCLGMFGLAAFTTQKRFKEIGVRKVHGSTGFGIVRLLSGDFSRLVIVSLLIALPIGYLILRNWLNRFAYRIQLEWWDFIVSGLITLIIAWITVGSQAIRAANINPAECLKDE